MLAKIYEIVAKSCMNTVVPGGMEVDINELPVTNEDTRSILAINERNHLVEIKKNTLGDLIPTLSDKTTIEVTVYAASEQGVEQALLALSQYYEKRFRNIITIMNENIKALQR